MKKIIGGLRATAPAVFILLLFVMNLTGGEPATVEKLVESKNWKALENLFGDASWRDLQTYFDPAPQIRCAPSDGSHGFYYHAKFQTYGEMGQVSLEKENNRYIRAEITGQFSRMSYTSGYRRFPAANTSISVGDARLTFLDGYFYREEPSGALTIFRGNVRFDIRPDDPEERRTLLRHFKSDTFTREARDCIMVLDPVPWKETTTRDPLFPPDDENVREWAASFRDAYGVWVPAFNEHWRLPFPQGASLILFRKEKNGLYQYYFNPAALPDTALTDTESQSMILGYNAEKGMKLSFGIPSRPESLELDLFYDPDASVVSGSVAASWGEASPVRQLLLENGVELVRNLDETHNGTRVFRRKDSCYLIGQPQKTIRWYFQGAPSAHPGGQPYEIFKVREGTTAPQDETQWDPVYYLSRLQNFYPNPGEDFYKTTLTARVPHGYNLLAPGPLMEKTVLDDHSATIFKYGAVISRGVALAAGRFGPAREIPAGEGATLRFHTYDGLDPQRRLDITDIADAFAFFRRQYGPLENPSLNILLRRGAQEGGLSNTGFIIINLPPDRAVLSQMSSRALSLAPTPSRRVFSPAVIRDKTEDYVFHEMAHQWWGGSVSWKSYRDVWISEGMAQFSILYYLKTKLSAGEFNRAAKRLKRWVLQYADCGPVVYGTRVQTLERDLAPFQAVVYNKPALIMLMLMDIIGEKDFGDRLKRTLTEWKYNAVSTHQFIHSFSQNNPQTREFLTQWLNRRDIPEVELSLAENEPGYDAKEFKTIFIRVKQLGEPFIFPLKLRVSGGGGAPSETVLMEKAEQVFRISRESAIRAVDVDDSYYLVKERKRPSRTPPGKKPNHPGASAP